MPNDTAITLLVGFGSAVIGAAAALYVPVIQRKLDKKSLSDAEMFKYWRSAFDRSAFRGPFTWQSDQQRFEQAIRDTIQAINTGYAASQNPEAHGAPKSYLKNPEWLKVMDEVADHLKNITWVLSGRTSQSQAQIAEIADKERDAAVKLLNQVLVQLKLIPLDTPTEVKTLYNG